MSSVPQNDITAPAIRLLKQVEGRPVFLYEDGLPAAALISMDDYEIVRLGKVERFRQACEAMAREIEANGGIDDETFAELTVEND